MPKQLLTSDLIANPGQWHLVLELSREELLVMAYCPYEQHSLLYRRIELDKSASRVMRAIEDAVYDNPLLLSDFGRITILLSTPHHLLLPQECSESDGKRFFRASFPEDSQRQESTIIINEMRNVHCRLAFDFASEVVNFLRRTFPVADTYHSIEPLMHWFTAKNSGNINGKMLVNVQPGRLEIITFGERHPQGVESHFWNTKEDVLYYILNTRRNLQLRDTDEIILAGNLALRQTIFPVLREYVRYVVPAVFPSLMFNAGRDVTVAPFEMVVAPLAMPRYRK